ncbi:B-cell receptor CD22-like [Pempheris klunzingeri]|uniref:B-cell receptor CD22-like n=1 Tax=Pempheris klunzingeri TaxID=3127111 RepID=UPI00397F6FF8
MSPSEDVIKGSSVTFTCSSDANPPVTQSGYRLYKDGHLINSGQNHTVSDLQPSHSGWYCCQAWNNISRRGISFINSTEIQLDVQYGPVNISVSMDPPHVVEGSSVNLTCSSAANPAAHNYSWYKRTASPSSTIQVGSGQVLSLPSVEASHAGLYLCQARNPLGENNSTDVLLSMKKEEQGSQLLPILAGVGVSLPVTLVLALLLFWMKQRNHAEKKWNSHLEHDAQTSNGDEVTYSTVTIKPRNSSPPEHINNSRSKAEENDDTVIYTTVAISS